MAEKDLFDIDSFEYAKQESYKDELDVPIPAHDLKNEEVTHNINPDSNLPNDNILNSFGESLQYEKDWGRIDPYLIIVICEDAKRSYQYFNKFIHQINNSKCKLIPIHNKEQGIPFPHMVQTANIKAEEMGVNLEEGDTIFLISDLDHYRHSILKEVQSDEWNNKYQLIISNPCVEIWFYYHLEDTPPNIDIKDKSEDQISGLMKSYNNSVKPGGIDHRKLVSISQLNIGIKNSKRNFKMEDNGIIPSLFSTQMHIVAEKLKDAMI